jgi:hypothetical protein
MRAVRHWIAAGEKLWILSSALANRGRKPARKQREQGLLSWPSRRNRNERPSVKNLVSIVLRTSAHPRLFGADEDTCAAVLESPDAARNARGG